MAKQKDELLTISEAARELGVSRASLYSRVKRSHDKGEETPFVADEKSGKGVLVAPKKALLAWTGMENKPVKSLATRRRKHIPPKAQPLVTLPMPSSQADYTPESVSPLATSTESTTAKALEPLLPRPTTGAPVIEALPEGYMENRLAILPRDAATFVVYWDVNPETARQHATSRWALKVKSEAGERVIEVHGGAKNWYLRGYDLLQYLEVFFGPMDEFGNLSPVARSVWIAPAAAVENDGFIEWGTGVRDANGMRLEVVASPAPVIAPSASAALRGTVLGKPGTPPSSAGVSSWIVQRQ